MKQSRVRKYLSTTFASLVLAYPAISGDLDGKLTGSVKVNLDPVSQQTIEDKSTAGTTKTTTTDGMSHSGTGNMAMRGRKSSNGYFALGKVSIDYDFGSGGSSNADVDEAFGQFGTRSWNFEIGRVGGDGVYNMGQDTLMVGVDGAPSVYEANDVSADGVAFNWTKGVEFQVYMPIHNDGTYTYRGIRPRIEHKFGDVTAKFAYEMQEAVVMQRTETKTSGSATVKDPDEDPVNKFNGYGLGLGYDTDKLSLELSLTSRTANSESTTTDATTSVTTEDVTDVTTTSTGLVFNYYLGADTIGFGYHTTAATTGGETTTAGAKTDKDDVDATHSQLFVSYAHATSVDGAFFRYALSTANAEIAEDVTGTALGARVQFTYDF